MAGWELDAVETIGVFDQQFAAVVFVRCGEEQSCGKVGANPLPGGSNSADGSIHMGAEVTASCVAIKHRRKNLERKGGRHEQGGAGETGKNHLSELHRNRMALRQLEVFLYALCLVAGGDFAVNPLRRVESRTRTRNFTGDQYIGNRD